MLPQQQKTLQQHFQPFVLQQPVGAFFTQVVPQILHPGYPQAMPTPCSQQPLANPLLHGQLLTQPIMVMAGPPPQPLPVAAAMQQVPAPMFPPPPPQTMAGDYMVHDGMVSEDVPFKSMPPLPPWRLKK